MELSDAQQFAQEWIDAWNSHDLERILGHYSDDLEMSSPVIVQIAGEATGRLTGKKAVGDYWHTALGMIPDLHFELIAVLLQPGRSETASPRHMAP